MGMPKPPSPALLLAVFAMGALAGLALAIVVPMEPVERVTSGDILALAGSIMGVVLAVAGALLVEQWNRASRKRADKQLIYAGVADFWKTLQALPEQAAGDINLLDEQSRILGLLDRMIETREVLAVARELVRIEDFEGLRALHRLERAMNKIWPQLEREIAFVGQSPTAAVINNFFPNASQIYERVRDDVGSALKELNPNE